MKTITDLNVIYRTSLIRTLFIYLEFWGNDEAYRTYGASRTQMWNMTEFRRVFNISKLYHDVMDNVEGFSKVRFIWNPFLYCEVGFMACATNEWNYS